MEGGFLKRDYGSSSAASDSKHYTYLPVLGTSTLQYQQPWMLFAKRLVTAYIRSTIVMFSS